MAEAPITIQRPQRWDVPFGPDMAEADVDRLMSVEPFKAMDESKFPASGPLRGILLNDTRIVRYKAGDIIVREGDYGNSAFLILFGTVRVILDGLPPEQLGRRKREKRGLVGALSQWWTNPRMPEVRDPRRYAGGQQPVAARTRGQGADTHIFLQDFDTVVRSHKTAKMESGAMFGELAALGRTPRTATVVADGDVDLLEIRWQGLRDLRRRADALKEYIDRIYRERALKSHLRETPLLKHLTDEEIQQVADATEFETFGSFDWFGTYKTIAKETSQARLAKEPMIAEEGGYPNGLIMIRGGFARVTRKFGNGSRTLSYLGKGQIYGLEEIGHNARMGQNSPWQTTLRAIGYVDVIRIPTPIVEKYILPKIPLEELPALPSFEDEASIALPLAPRAGKAAEKAARARDKAHDEARPSGGGKARSKLESPIEPGMLESLVENRYINGTATMMIDLDRCTRCDDCVRACANGHNNNPRFFRHGFKFGHHMIANACMHCQDPVCMIGCPTGAISRDPLGGQVVINDNTCIGCATCANSCPYSNIRMVEIRDRRGEFILDQETKTPIVKATKCDLCVDQIGGPACQRACPHDALRRVDMRDLPTLAGYLDR